MRNKIVLPLVGVLSALVLAAAFVFRPLPTSITAVNADRIKPGMSHAQVVALLGEPRSEVAPSAVPKRVYGLSATIAGRSSPERPHVFRRMWTSESTHVAIIYDMATDCVTSVDVSPHEFDSGVAFLNWRVRRVLGLAPDEPTPLWVTPEGGP